MPHPRPLRPPALAFSGKQQRVDHSPCHPRTGYAQGRQELLQASCQRLGAHFDAWWLRPSAASRPGGRGGCLSALLYVRSALWRPFPFLTSAPGIQVGIFRPKPPCRKLFPRHLPARPGRWHRQEGHGLCNAPQPQRVVNAVGDRLGSGLAHLGKGSLPRSCWSWAFFLQAGYRRRSAWAGGAYLAGATNGDLAAALARRTTGKR